MRGLVALSGLIEICLQELLGRFGLLLNQAVHKQLIAELTAQTTEFRDLALVCLLVVSTKSLADLGS